ncbi:RNA polymerase sigma factor SigE [Haematomicrobium sanguinis]|uniref:RNA polymerase sigma factor SigE n=1 Tax=Haematomicrobium sanguinis TaxID=479106 RepID=UPI000B1CD14F|nr:RNA polymerase sigma factor SigE [Haematomicrobium sanguinis]
MNKTASTAPVAGAGSMARAGDRIAASVDSAAALPVSEVPTGEEIVRQHGAQVMRLAYRLTGNKHDAEDLAQEAFVRVIKSLDTFQPGTMGGWLHRITTNLFLDQARRKSRIRFDALLASDDSRLSTDVGGPERSYELNNLDRDIIQALAELQPEYRAAVVLSDLEGFSYDEVATMLGIKLGTVRSRIHRGRVQLREKLAHRAPRSKVQRPKAPKLGVV